MLGYLFQRVLKDRILMRKGRGRERVRVREGEEEQSVSAHLKIFHSLHHKHTELHSVSSPSIRNIGYKAKHIKEIEVNRDKRRQNLPLSIA